MPSEMWLPLLVMVLGFYCFAGFIVLLRMRSEILQRESNARWARTGLCGVRNVFRFFAEFMLMGNTDSMWGAYGATVAVLLGS